ncbi:hypothetical protein, partial [Gulbenkiania mobilis]|uniref:hypothetical protein n=1 Tax=Gulbenkiania mobilis TaxID=397457 RepID=UPI001910ECB0
YSSVHTELSLALKQLGHQVTTLSDGDAFKGFVPDIYFGVTAQSSVVKKIFRSILDFLGIKGLTLLFQKRKILAKCQGYDVVQLINPVTLEPLGALANILFINYLSRKNKKLFLCALGDDYSWVSACLEGRYKYSPLDRISIKTLINYRYSLRYVYGFFYRSLDKYVKKKCSAIIPGLLDYKMAHADCHKLTDLI